MVMRVVGVGQSSGVTPLGIVLMGGVKRDISPDEKSEFYSGFFVRRIKGSSDAPIQEIPVFTLRKIS